PLAAPTSVMATPGDNQIDLSWNAVAGATSYRIYRSTTPGGPYSLLGISATTSFSHIGLVCGVTNYYVVRAATSATCESPNSAEVTGSTTVLGVPMNVVATGGTGQVSLTWDAAAGATSYNIYRSTTPGGPYALIGNSATTSFLNTPLLCGTTYYYVIRGTKSATCESASSAEANAGTTTCPPCTTQTLYSNNFESGSGLADWTTGTFGGSAANWRGIQTCTAQSGSKIFRYGATSCTGDYGNNEFPYAQPNGAGGITIPAGARTSRLSFWHRRDFEAGFDGGLVTVSLNGTDYSVVPASAIVSGTTYNGVVAPDCAPAGSAGDPIFTGTATSFTQTVIDLDAACNVVTGGAAGCGGQAVRIGFATVTDCGSTGDGWFLDDVAVTTCVQSIPSDYYALPPCRLIDTRLP